MNPVSRNSKSIDEVVPISKVHQVNIPSASRTPSAQALPLNLPCQDLLDEGRREEYVEICLPLYIASRKGDWKKAKKILDKHKELVRFSITKNRETPLHVAVSRRHTKFVKNLLSLMGKEDLELQDNSSYTALCIAVRNGHVEMARILLQKNRALIDIPTSLGMMPLQMAASYPKFFFDRNMVKFLCENSQSLEGDFWTPESRSCFLLTCVEAEYFDVALKVLKDNPGQLALSGGGVLKLLAQKTEAFKRFPRFRPALPLLRSMLKNIAKLSWPEVYDLMRGSADPINKENAETNPIDTLKTYSSKVLFLAAEAGNIVFIVEIIRQYPELLNDVNDVNQSIFHVALSLRHVELFKLLFEIGSIKDQIITLEDEKGNNMLHLVGIFSESAKGNLETYVPGPAQRMQKEQLLFQLVEYAIPISLRKKKNAAGMTPHEEFIKHHKDLVSNGEKWIKDACSQLIVVAALLATISFAATITFPGGYNQADGYPVFSRKRVLFPSFIIFNSTAFLGASVSMIFALSLLTSRYAEDDFFCILPTKLITTVASLVISILATTIAFMFNLFLLFEKSTPLLPKLFAGIIFIHFGMFVVESNARYVKPYGERSSKRHTKVPPHVNDHVMVSLSHKKDENYSIGSQYEIRVDGKVFENDSGDDHVEVGEDEVSDLVNKGEKYVISVNASDDASKYNVGESVHVNNKKDNGRLDNIVNNADDSNIDMG
ncbi:Ankyrin repeat-containing protein [Artemisia annua]|uniref:Ankyrin repeat-containing protein n=1 Tax=Artemisia annua TaxID=35608 RepID=A0A2U1NN69_ARTAN|nr:Ankyrin repeat-containing protein [Artemisia annua]